MSRTAKHVQYGRTYTKERPWQYCGRCESCGGKIAGKRRVRVCLCGGPVANR